MSKSKILLYLCLAFIVGILVDSLLGGPRFFWPGILFLGTGKETIKQVGQYYDQGVVLKGIIIEEPEKRINQTKFQVKTKEIPGKILITTGLYPAYSYGDKIEINGQLKEPVQFEDFDYRQYLAKDKIYSVIYYPKITLLAKNQANWFYQIIFDFKDKLRKVINQTLLPPQGSILKAIFLGDKQSLSTDLKEKLNLTGTRHIVAISGMHMIIMTQILLFMALALGLWRGQAF